MHDSFARVVVRLLGVTFDTSTIGSGRVFLDLARTSHLAKTLPFSASSRACAYCSPCCILGVLRACAYCSASRFTDSSLTPKSGTKNRYLTPSARPVFGLYYQGQEMKKPGCPGCCGYLPYPAFPAVSLFPSFSPKPPESRPPEPPPPP